MADRDFSSISAALATLVENQVINQINRAVVLAQILAVQPADGKNVTWDVKTGTATPTTAPIADGDDVSNFNRDTKQPAVLQYGEYHDAFALTGRTLAAARATGNPQQLANLFLDDMADSVERLARAIGKDVYGGDGSTDHIHGLFDSSVPAIGDTGSYAGIDPNTYPQWAGTVLSGAAGLSFGLMRKLRRKIYVASGEKPDLIICHPTQHEAYGELFGLQRRYITEIRIQGNVIKLDGGYQVLEFDGIPVIEDEQCDEDKMAFISSRHVRLRQLPPADAEVTGMDQMVQLGGTPEEQRGPGRVSMAAGLLRLAKTGNRHAFALYCYPQLQIKRRNACGYIESLPVPA